MARARWVASLALLTSLLGVPLACGMFGEPKPDLEGAETFTGAGLRFEHPGNWETEVEQDKFDDLTMTMITVTSKHGNAVAIIQQFQPQAVVDRDQLVVEFFEGVRESMPGITDIRRLDGGEAEVISQPLLGSEREGRRLRYAIELLGETVPHTVDIVFAELEDRLVIVYTQIPDEDRSKAMPGFERISSSLALE